MSSASFRQEPFRTWNPFQDKSHFRDSLSIHRYPSPVSITTISPSSNSSDLASKHKEAHPHKSERHPLPARPPVEVCLDGRRPQEASTPPHQPAVEDYTLCVDPETENFGFEDILQLQDLPISEDEVHSMICDNVGLGSQRPLGFDSDDLGLTPTLGWHSQVGSAGSPFLTGGHSDATIDPAILDDHQLRHIEQTPATATEVFPTIGTPSPCSADGIAPRCRRQISRKTDTPGQQRSKKDRLAVIVDNRPTNRTGNFTRVNHRKKLSFSTLRDQFSTLPVEERLQFLSWLFEGALSQCFHSPSFTKDASASSCIPRREEAPTTLPEQSNAGTQVVDTKHTYRSRKGLPWSIEEDQLLVKLRQEENLSWSEVIKRFSQEFPGRKQGSIQVHWSTTLRKRQPS
ncbi:hypothetical protein NUU61_004553 [Penicillium alfredii]|uniref:Myb-like domain-containing protein n=1 Tax=Penicillium alfredii TaxID=1506179 RepID=A0A9W9KDY4_9EURO|nr:uncharacterized protein NUU61_004553 [Penicillium alfredii]KAJ5102331.1 hypothetical protein NUU61_004553 [Penicillium alfredii]